LNKSSGGRQGILCLEIAKENHAGHCTIASAKAYRVYGKQFGTRYKQINARLSSIVPT